MNSQIEAWRIQQYAANVYHLSQQDGSIIEPNVRQESFTGKAEFFDRLGKSTAQDKTGRNVDTPNLDTNHSRRMVTTITREWGTLVDRKDKLQNIHDPASEYAKSAAMALGRKVDNVLINAAFSKAASGEDGSSLVSLPNLQKVTSVSAGAIANPNTQMLRKAKRTLDNNAVKGTRYIVHAPDFLEYLLADSTITNHDFNSVRALVMGELDTFLGFKFLMCQEIDQFLASTFDDLTYKYDTTSGLYSGAGTSLAGTEKVALCFAEGAIIRGETQGSFIARIEERADKGYSQQIYTAIDKGAVRMEDEKVVQLIYKP